MSVSKFNIQNNAEDLVGYIFQITNSSPKKLRCDLVPTMRNYALQILECVIRANRLERISIKRHEFQQEALTYLELLNCSCELCSKFTYITQHQFDVAMDKTFTLIESINKWIDSDKTKV